MKRWLRYLNAMAHEEDQVWRLLNSPEHIRREKSLIPSNPLHDVTGRGFEGASRRLPQSSCFGVNACILCSHFALILSCCRRARRPSSQQRFLMTHFHGTAPVVRTRISPSSDEGGPRPYCRSAQPPLKNRHCHGWSLAVLVSSTLEQKKKMRLDCRVCWSILV